MVTSNVIATPIAPASPGRTSGEWRNNGAFAALKADGSVVTWGNSGFGGDSSAVASQLSSGVSQIFSTGSAFAALKSDGSIVTWGDSTSGGNSTTVASQVGSGVAAFANPFTNDWLNGGNGTASAITAQNNATFSEGVTLLAGSISNDPDGMAASPNYKYQWLLNGAAISGATGSTYTTSATGFGSYTVQETYTDAQVFSVTLSSAELVVAKFINVAPTDLLLSVASFNENIVAGSAVATLSSLDPNTVNTFTYSLIAGTGSTDNGAFSISGNQIKINASPNFEAKSAYRVRLRTADQGGLFFDKSFVLAVNNVNEAPTAITASALNFNENMAAGSTVTSLSMADPDAGNTFGYALVAGTGSGDNAAFTISGNQLKINVSPDFEVKSSCSVRVRTTDQGGLFFEKSMTFAVNNVVEKVTASVSTVLAPNKDTLQLTGTGAIFGVGNQANNSITGNSGKNQLMGGLGKDCLTGVGGLDTFLYGSLRETLLSGFDVITDYAAGEKLDVTFNFASRDLIASAGSIAVLGATQISALLISSRFLANTAAAFTAQGFSGTFVALNDGVSGFQAENDGLIHLSNYSIGASNSVSII